MSKTNQGGHSPTRSPAKDGLARSPKENLAYKSFKSTKIENIEESLRRHGGINATV